MLLSSGRLLRLWISPLLTCIRKHPGESRGVLPEDDGLEMNTYAYNFRVVN